jgi:endoglucanase
MTAADTITMLRDASGYGRGVMRYYWGSNGSVARTAMVLAAANQLSGEARYLDVAVDQISWLFGRNQYNRSQVTGLGVDPPLHPHNRSSAADGIVDPWPGLLVGGGTTATNWEDVQDNYMVNENAINWNGALVYALALFLPTGEWPPLPPDPDPPVDAGSDAGDVDAGSDAPVLDAGGLPPRNGGGCGCRVGSDGVTPWAPLLIVAGTWARRRRRGPV